MAATPKTSAERPRPRVSKPRANKIALRDAIAAMNDGSAAAYLGLFRPDARLHGFPSGIEDVNSLSEFHVATADMFPDASVTLDDAVAENDRVATRFTWRATHAPGVTLVAQGGAIVRFADGQIAECWNLPAEVETVVSDDATVQEPVTIGA